MNAEIYDDDIDLALAEYVESRNIEDERKMTSSMWAACMQFIGDKVFKNGDLLRDKNTWNNEPYDLDKVLSLVKKYTFLCNDHNQRICVEHFSMLSGIHKSTISLWANELRRSGDKRAKQIYMLLMDGAMQAADDLMVSRTSVTSIAYRNATEQRYNEYKTKQQEPTIAMSADIIDRLGIAEELKQIGTHPDEIELLPELADDTTELPIV